MKVKLNSLKVIWLAGGGSRKLGPLHFPFETSISARAICYVYIMYKVYISRDWGILGGSTIRAAGKSL